jgi:hypothetical protein
MASSPTTDCIYRSVTLQAGESYVLPPDAELVMVDGVITSEANCAPTDNLEEVQCYILYSLADNERGSDGRHPYEGGPDSGTYNTYISAVNIGSASYSCSIVAGDAGDMFYESLVSFISGNSALNGIFLNMSIFLQYSISSLNTSKLVVIFKCFKHFL